MPTARGAIRHPKVYDPVTLKIIRKTFHEILDELDDQVVFSARHARHATARMES
jgi:hypothetical protein